MSRATGFLFVCLLVPALTSSSCAPAPRGAAATPAAADTATVGAASTEPSPPEAPNSAAPAQSPPAASPPTLGELELKDVKRVLESPVHSLGFGKKGRAAALGTDAYMDSGRGFEKLTAPVSVSEHVQIYFGRDNMPRIMGYAGTEGVYGRWRKQTWQRGLDEIGRLGAGSSPFFGVLGYADPEVVCRVGEVCLVKRLTGWKTVNPPPGTPQVVLLSGSVAWAFDRTALYRLHDDKEWRKLDGVPSLTDATALAGGDDNLWVGSGGGVLHHFDGKAWSQRVAPTGSIRGMLTEDKVLWVVGDDGALFFDGAAWKRVKGVQGPLSIAARDEDGALWFAGKSGVWKAQP